MINNSTYTSMRFMGSPENVTMLITSVCIEFNGDTPKQRNCNSEAMEILILEDSDNQYRS